MTETFEHQDMKKRMELFGECYEWDILGVEKSLGNLRPDLFMKKHGVKIAVECQCSKISLEEFIDRNASYVRMDVPVVWVFGREYFRNAVLLIEWVRKNRNRNWWDLEDYDEEYSYQVQRITYLEKWLFENNGVLWYFDGDCLHYATWKPRWHSKTLGWYNLHKASFRVLNSYLDFLYNPSSILRNHFHSHFVTGGVALVLKKLSKPQFLSVDEVEEGGVVTVVEEPYIVPADQTKYGKERGRVVVRLSNGEDRSWTMNNTTWDALIDGFGAEPEKWLQKKVQLRKEQMTIRGEEKTVLYGKPHSETKTPVLA